MPNYAITNPYPVILGKIGLPLNAGFVFIGEPNKDPETFPIAIFWDAAGADPAFQPLRTIGGYIVKAGSPAEVFCSSAYSIRVRDAVGAQVFYAPSVRGQLEQFIAEITSEDGANAVGFSFSTPPVSGTVGAALNGLRNVMAGPYNAKADNIANDSGAIQAASADGVFFTPDRSIKMDTAITGTFRSISTGTQFTGSQPLDAQYPSFGPAALKVIARGPFFNSIVGIAHNTGPASTASFPTGVTGYGRNDNAGNTAFGGYFEARQYADTGCVTNEIDSFNHAAAPSPALPPSRGIGTTQQQPIALTVGAGGTADSSIGIHICQEGSSPRKFLTGIYVDASAVVTYGIFIDAEAGSTYTSAVIKHSTAQVALRMTGAGALVANNALMVYSDDAGFERFGIKQDGRISISSLASQTTRGTAGSAQVLPANPSGYYKILVDGVQKVIPYYEQA